MLNDDNNMCMYITYIQHMHSSQCQNAYHILSNHKNSGIDSHEFKTSNLYWMFPKDRGKTPKWMVKIMENPIRMG